MNAGLILAGGKGERLTGQGKPKQFIEVGGKPLILYCLQAFEQCPDISLICVVIAEDRRDILNGEYIYANPGKSRQHSSRSGLLALKPYNPARVVIHDAARPLVTAEDITALIRAAEGFDGATPVLPVTDTIYRSADGKTIGEALNRDELFAGQTPECYDFKKYLAAHEKQTDDELSVIRGGSELAARAGMRIALAEGSPDNFKITTNADLERFRETAEKNESAGFARDKRFTA
jgi:2-C-methyl-D-erythritol 4-phosphate cytidylyltransferase